MKFSPLPPVLLPSPKSVRLVGGVSKSARVRFVQVDIGRAEPGAYRLTISPELVLIESSEESGAFYAKQTLAQLRSQYGDNLPCLRILDWPDYPVRGFYHDVTRGKVPKLKTLLALADKCAHYKLNQLHLYIEHTYAFKCHPKVWQGADPLTADEIRTLDAHCAKRHIDLVPSFSTFGHLYGWIHTKEFQHLNELERDVSDEPFNWWDGMMHYTLDCRNPESIALVREIISEVRPLFRSQFFNICADETFDLGKGKNRAMAKRVGEGRLYVDFLKQIMAAVREAGAIPMFWGDIIGKHPKLLKELPRDVVALDWDYSTDLGHSIAPLIAKAGLPFYVCPGVSGWKTWLNNSRVAHRNIVRFARRGLEHGACGLLNTDWGDFGHINSLGLSFPGLILGASAAWNTRSQELSEFRFESAASRCEFGDPSGRLLTLLRQAASLAQAKWQNVAFWQQPRSKDFDGWFDPASGLPNDLFTINARKHKQALTRLRSLLPKIERCLETSSPGDPLVADEIRTGMLGVIVMEELAIFLQARCGRTRIEPPKAGDLARRLRLLDEQLFRVWHKRNKKSEYFRISEVLRGAANQVADRSFLK